MLTAGWASAQQLDTRPVPTRDDAQRVVDAIDAAITAGDREAFLRCFAPTHPEPFDRLLARVTPLLRPGLDLERHSRIERFWVQSDLGVAVTKTETIGRCASNTTRTVAENLLMVFGRAATGNTQDDELRATLLIEIDPAWLPHVLPNGGPRNGQTSDAQAEDAADSAIVLRCPACNYALRVDDQWLAVPNCRQRSGCYESFALFALHADLSATLSLHLARGCQELGGSGETPRPREAVVLLTALTAANPDSRTGATASPVIPWLPPVYAGCDPPLAHLNGARCRVDDAVRGRATELRLLTFGRLGYLLTIDGSTAALATRRAAIDTLLAGFRLEDPDLAPEQVAAQVLAGHAGGQIDGAEFTDPRLGLRMSGPADWSVRVDVGQYAVDVTWECPAERGTLRAKGLEPPIGTTAWSDDTADRALVRALERDGLVLVTDSDWRPRTGDGFLSERDLEAHGTGGRTVLLRVARSDDLLLVLEGEVRDPTARGALRRAFDSAIREP